MLLGECGKSEMRCAATFSVLPGNVVETAGAELGEFSRHDALNRRYAPLAHIGL